MLEPERHQIILDLLKKQNTVKLQELVELTNSSESTIRRDLSQLEKQKLLKRVHGGAARLQNMLQEPTMVEKSSKNVQEKRLIAKYAASLIEEGDSVYIDAGTTPFEMIPFLPSDIVVVTNGLMHVEALLNRNIKTFLVGGYVKPTTKALVGRSAIESLKNFRFDKCFMGVNGIHPDYGFTTPDPEEATVKQLAITLTRDAYVVADESKFSEVTFARIADLKDAMIITNAIDKEIQSQYERETTIKVVSA
ncbi:DeoR/GlpR family DNA-binding transcription regulator [Pallidibacillus thermolactis]|uniref:DeoR/GlpR family DNA-binding transcription regulator n=1 Tax=Pallidibacillus thermolactis TaxID=251051 RepID=UPI002E227435|nr:DeoR/GlpR family DNA-binding transcription regulator [Pallidibacillus thermolactis subsp. kokeshiiformis]